MVIFSALHNRYIFTNFSASKLFLILEHTKSYIEKIHSVDAELAGHACKLDVKLESLCGSGSLFAVRILSNFRSELTNNTLQNQRWGTLLYPQF